MKQQIIEAVENLKNTRCVDFSTYIQSNFLHKKIVIYGAGGFGKEIADVFKTHHLNPIAFLDINVSGNYLDIPIFHPEKFAEKEDVIVVLAIVLNKDTREKITRFIYQCGFKTVMDAQKIRAMYVELENGFSYENFKANLLSMVKPPEYLEDKESKETFCQNLISHIARNYDNTVETTEKEQYFLKNIKFTKGFSSFIDCGAYNGDTFEQLIKNNSDVNSYFGFEPIMNSFSQLIQKTKKTKITSISFPLAVSGKTRFLKFDDKSGSSSKNELGMVNVLAVCLDDVLNNQNITFLKMDIEGEELNALNGARELITSQKPDLAICVYHYINHFWEIPNLIYSWDLGYKFYMRTHSSACMETVLYATQREL